MQLIRTAKFINRHPLSSKSKVKAYGRFFRWQIGQLFLKQSVVVPFIEDSVLLAKKGMTGATGNIYTGLHEFEEMAFLIHFLKEENLFFDVGANIGSYTVLASKVIGATSYSFEPSPTTFKHLENNVFLNRIQGKANCFNMGIGEVKGEMYFSKGLDTTNHIQLKKKENNIKINIDCLDNICLEKSICPQLIKIDVEGFETKVLEGSYETLQNSKLKAIILELNGSGGRYDFDENKIHNDLLKLGFLPYNYLPFERKLIKRKERNFHGNTIYIRDISYVEQEVIKGKKFRVLDIEL